MPLDMRETRLTDIAGWRGIRPVPNDVLTAHMLNEESKHPGSWWYHHAKLGTGLAVTSFLLSAISFCVCVGFTIIAMSDDNARNVFWGATAMLGFWTTCAWITVKGFFSVRGVKVHGPAVWHEFAIHTPAGLRDVPDSIRVTAESILRDVPDAEIVCGKLLQDSVVIDPYLVVRRGNDEICLGIWDDDGIIHEATTD